MLRACERPDCQSEATVRSLRASSSPHCKRDLSVGFLLGYLQSKIATTSDLDVDCPGTIQSFLFLDCAEVSADCPR
jgi:hypothetical protein